MLFDDPGIWLKLKTVLLQNCLSKPWIKSYLCFMAKALVVAFTLAVLNITAICHARDRWKSALFCKQLRLLYPPDPLNLPWTALRSRFQSFAIVYRYIIIQDRAWCEINSVPHILSVNVKRCRYFFKICWIDYILILQAPQVRISYVMSPFYHKNSDSQCLFRRIPLPGPCFNVRTNYSGIRISNIKIGRSWIRLIFIMGVPILVRRRSYIETPPEPNAGLVNLSQYKNP